MKKESILLGKNTSKNEEARGRDVVITDDTLTVELIDGRSISTPLIWYPRLFNAKPKDRQTWKWRGDNTGINWPLLDEDLSIRGMLEGNPAVDYYP